MHLVGFTMEVKSICHVTFWSLTQFLPGRTSETHESSIWKAIRRSETLSTQLPSKKQDLKRTKHSLNRTVYWLPCTYLFSLLSEILYSVLDWVLYSMIHYKSWAVAAPWWKFVKPHKFVKRIDVLFSQKKGRRLEPVLWTASYTAVRYTRTCKYMFIVWIRLEKMEALCIYEIYLCYECFQMH